MNSLEGSLHPIRHMNADWRDGFLFLGNRLSFDFLNTRPVANGELVEFLPDAPSVARWLKAAELVSEPVGRDLELRWSTGGSRDQAAEELRKFRERLRNVLFALETGRAPSSAFIAELNELLATHPTVHRLSRRDGDLTLRRTFEPQSPLDAFAPIVEDVADLLANGDTSRIRKCVCPACVLHFYDTSKKGTRRWCSMNLCGNRAKVAAYASRKRNETSCAN